MSTDDLTTKDFRGYRQASLPNIDESLSRVGPETSCGEYLRRYWHPVSLTSDVKATGCQYRLRYSPHEVLEFVLAKTSSILGTTDCL